MPRLGGGNVPGMVRASGNPRATGAEGLAGGRAGGNQGSVTTQRNSVLKATPSRLQAGNVWTNGFCLVPASCSVPLLPLASSPPPPPRPCGSLVFGHNMKSSNDFIGRIVIGQYSSGPSEANHWRRMLNTHRTAVGQWHSLRSRAECDRVSPASLEVT